MPRFSVSLWFNQFRLVSGRAWLNPQFDSERDNLATDRTQIHADVRNICAQFIAEDDPCPLVWQVKEISLLETNTSLSTRPLPARPAGESDSDADELQDIADSFCCSSAVESDSPATQGGRGLSACPCGSSHGISFTCRTSRQGSLSCSGSLLLEPVRHSLTYVLTPLAIDCGPPGLNAKCSSL